MNIYNRLSSNIQTLVNTKIVKKNMNKVLEDIIKKRKNLLIKTIRKNYPTFADAFYYWFNIPDDKWGSYYPKKRYIEFIKKILPDIPNNTFKIIDQKNTYYNYEITRRIYTYYNKTYKNPSYHDFYKRCLNNLSVEYLEDFYNYIKYIHYGTGVVNKCFLIMNK